MPHSSIPALSHGPAVVLTPEDSVDAVSALVRAARVAPEAGIRTIADDGTSESMPYPVLLERARVVLAGLQVHGLGPGDRLILQGLPLPDYFPALWACLLGGIQPATIADQWDEEAGPPPARLTHTWELLGRPLVVCDSPRLPPSVPAPGPEGLRRLHVAALRREPAAELTYRPHTSDVAVLMLSSGSTGVPKAARITHGALAEFAVGSRSALGMTADDVSFNWMPVDHSGALFLYHMVQVFAGCTNVHAPTEWVLEDPLRWLDVLAAQRVSHSWAPMFGYRLITEALAREEHGRHGDLSAVRTLVSGGERIVPRTVAEFLSAVAPFGVPADAFRPSWGMAETTTGITWARLAGSADAYCIRRDSLDGELVHADPDTPECEVVTYAPSGRPAAGAAVRIVGAEDQLLTERRIGRVHVRSARVTTGYVGNPAATSAALREDGWLETGDLGFLADGELVVTGRAKDTVVLRGLNYACQEIEEVAAMAAGVSTQEVGAGSAGDVGSGEQLVVCVATASTDRAALARLAQDVRAGLFATLRLGDATVYPVPRGDFPRTGSGKVRRGELMRRIAAGELRPAPGPERGTGRLAPEPAAGQNPGPSRQECPSDRTARTSTGADHGPDGGGRAPSGQGGAGGAPSLGPDSQEKAGRNVVEGIEEQVRRSVHRALAAVLGHQADDHTPFFELGLTSLQLGRVRGLLHSELPVSVPLAAFFEHPTAAALTAHIASRGCQTAGAAALPLSAEVPAARRPSGADRSIAVIGMAARLPGATGLAEFWANLRAGTDSVRVFDRAETAAAGISEDVWDDPAFRPVAGALADADAFDAAFFGISPKEAALTDPAHRLFLQSCHHALEHAGYAGDLGADRIGVYAGCGMQLYGHQDGRTVQDQDALERLQAAFGSEPDFLATRVAHRLGLTGPAVNVKTACSTALVAVHLAIQALLDGDAEMALAGAAAVRMPQEAGYRHVPGSILSASGRCRPFDAEADGTVGGNGVGVVLLKPLTRALADGDTVHAVIIGSAVNNDGRGRAGFSAPGVKGQTEVVRQALSRADVAPETISYVEAHGTGTAVGDPIEFRALAEALGTGEDRVGTCALGSVKGNIGHLDTAAGMAGLLKTILMLQHRELVPTVNLDRPHPELPVAESPFRLVTTREPWRAVPGVPRRAGVSALGVGGTNAHVILQEAPPVGNADRAPLIPGGTVAVPLSAAAPEGLADLAERVAKHLDAHPHEPLADVVATLALGRPHLAHRRAVTGRTAGEIAAALRRAPREQTADAAPGRMAFVFSGQGGVWQGMGRALSEGFPSARDVIEECGRHNALPEAVFDLLLGDDGPRERAWPTDVAQPALFVLQVAQYEAWRSLGIRPDLVLGHSAGEYAALYAAGALSLADGLRLTAERGRLMRDTAPGGMLAITATAARAREIADICALDLAAVNGPERYVLSGPADSVTASCGVLDAERVPWRRLRVDRAFHSRLMDPVLDGLDMCLRRAGLKPLDVPLITAVDGMLHPRGALPPEGYLRRQARAAVDFAAAVHTAQGQGCTRFLEVGPDRALASAGRSVAAGSRWVTGQYGPGSDDALWPALAELYELGIDPDWSVMPSARGRRIPLPLYPFRTTRFPAATRPAPTAGPTPTAALERIGGILAEQLGTDTTAVDPSRTFLEQGADSLSLIALAAAFEEEFSLRVPVRQLLTETATPQQLAAHIVATAGPRSPLPATVGLPETEGAPAAGDETTVTQSPAAAEDLVPEGEGAPAFAVMPASARPLASAGLGATDNPRDAAPPRDANAAHPARQGAAHGDGLALRQLEVAERLIERVTGLMHRQLDAAAGAPAPQTAAAASLLPAASAEPVRIDPAHVPTPASSPPPIGTPALPTSGLHDARHPAQDRRQAPPPDRGPSRTAGRPASPASDSADGLPSEPPHELSQGLLPSVSREVPQGTDFSLYFFGDYPDGQEDDKYDLILRSAEFADTHGFHTLWLPERHFHSFGALFPNPSVLAAALAGRTRHVRLHAGSVVLPLHHAARVAEEWSVVDNLSHGRAGLCFASGWHADDFVLAPENFGNHRQLMYDRLATVRALWRGEELRAPSGTGEETAVRIHPRPVQDSPPMFAAVVSNPDSYRKAAEHDLGVVTNLMSQSVEELAANIALYRETRARHGLDPAAGRVVVLVHTYLGQDHAAARAEAFAPFCSYLQSSLSLFSNVANSLGLEVDLDHAHPDDVQYVLEQAYARYCDARALIGSPERCEPVITGLLAAGVDEIACFVDFGVAKERVLAGLSELDALRRRPRSRPVRLTETATGADTSVQACAAPPVPAVSPAELQAPAHQAAERIVPLNAAQRRILFLEQVHPGRTTYHEPKAIRLRGPLDADALRGAFDQMLVRHPVLMSTVVTRRDEPYLRIPPDGTLDLPLDDRTGQDEEQAIRAVVADELRTPLDLAAGPLVRARLIRLAADHHVLFLLAHHIVFDSRSTRILTEDLGAAYRSWPAMPAGLPAPLPPVDEDSLSAGDRADHLAYWQRALAGAPELQLPVDRQRPARSNGRGGYLTHRWRADTARRIQATAREHQATVFGVLLSAVCVALSRLSGQDDLVVGTGLTHRPEGTENAVGMYVETIPLRVDLSGDPSFGELARRLTLTGMAAYEHRAVPFDELVHLLNPARLGDRNPLFQVAVEFEDDPGTLSFDAPRVTADLLDVPSHRAPVDVMAYLTQDRDGVRCVVEYDTDLFDEGTVRRLLDYVDLTLSHALDDPATRLSALPALTEADRQALDSWQGAAVEPPAAGDCLSGLIRRRMREASDSVALVHGDLNVTYGQLASRVDRLASRLESCGAGPGVLVGVCLPRGIDMIVSVLAVLECGAAYLPLDGALPEDRRDFMVHDSGTALLVAGSEALERWARGTGMPLCTLHSSDPDGSPAPTAATDAADRTVPDVEEGTPARPRISPDDLAYCIYTSGSTGRPKAVEVLHRGVVNLVRWDLATHAPQDTLQWSSPGFDAGVMEIFTTLASGARLVLMDDGPRYDPAALADLIRRHRVERVFMPFTPLKYLMEARPLLPSLRSLISAGEVTGCTPALQAFLTAHPACALFNYYGPTEGSVCATGHRVEPGDPAPPIGRPIAGVEVRLLDGSGRPVPVGARGEIHLAGLNVARGYRNRPEETARVFLPDPERQGGVVYRTGDIARWRPDGTLQFLGRADDQVKIRGHRVEPSEVQRAVAQLDGVKDAAVIARDDRKGESELVGYVVLETAARDRGLDGHELAARLSACLPGPFVPRTWVVVEALPLNPSGKVDRSQLPEPASPSSTPAPPAGELESILHEVWCQELGDEAVDVTRPFFESGGHSLTAVRLLDRVQRRLGVRVSLADFFQAPTIRDMAALLGPCPIPGSTAADPTKSQVSAERAR